MFCGLAVPGHKISLDYRFTSTLAPWIISSTT